MQLFDPKMQESLGFKEGDRVWYFDLDTIIAGPLDRLIEYPGAFGILEDVYRKGGLQSSVMSWIAGTALVSSIWEEWTARGQPRLPGGDQAVLEAFWASWLPARMKVPPSDVWPPDKFQELYPGVLRSYKVDCVWEIPVGTSVIFFHGLPRPQEVATGWVPQVWKVGGGVPASLKLVANIDDARMKRNHAFAIAQGYEELTQIEKAHEGVALLIGGGPSLASQIPLIGMLKDSGAMIFATNNTDKYLREHGIIADFHVLMDAKPENIAHLCPGGVKLYATQVDSEVLKRAQELGELMLWRIAPQPGPELQIGGGTSVGTRTMVLAFVLGYRRLNLFGMDSCYTGDAHHAYPQSWNDGERVLDVSSGGEQFRCAPWMAQQAEDFKILAPTLNSHGCAIQVFGGGLLSRLIEQMNGTAMLHDGLWWPSEDVETRRSVMGSLGDLDHYVSLCKERRRAVQAGGNVGVWPKQLAKHFTEVVTFEPDSINYDCLTRNVSEPNVRHQRCALGEQAGAGAVVRDPANCGASAVAQGADFPIITLDSLSLDHVDLLQLDVEGFEFQALKGAKDTIARCSPLIVLELKGLGQRYGYADAEVEAWLTELGYERTGVAHRDVIYQRKSA